MIFFPPLSFGSCMPQFLLTSMLMKNFLLYIYIEMATNSIKKTENYIRLSNNIEIALVDTFQFEDGEPQISSFRLWLLQNHGDKNRYTF